MDLRSDAEYYCSDYVIVGYATGGSCDSTDTNLWTEILGSSTGSIETSGTLSSSSTRTCLALLCNTASGCVFSYSKLQLTCTTETYDTLSDAVIAGIVIGCIVAVALSIVACAWCCKCCCFQQKVDLSQPQIVVTQPVMPMQAVATQPVVQMTRTTKPATPVQNFCSSCGKPITGPFCGNCGAASAAASN